MQISRDTLLRTMVPANNYGPPNPRTVERFVASVRHIPDAILWAVQDTRVCYLKRTQNPITAGLFPEVDPSQYLYDDLIEQGNYLRALYQEWTRKLSQELKKATTAPDEWRLQRIFEYKHCRKFDEMRNINWKLGVVNGYAERHYSAVVGIVIDINPIFFGSKGHSFGSLARKVTLSKSGVDYQNFLRQVSSFNIDVLSAYTIPEISALSLAISPSHNWIFPNYQAAPRKLFWNNPEGASPLAFYRSQDLETCYHLQRAMQSNSRLGQFNSTYNLIFIYNRRNAEPLELGHSAELVLLTAEPEFYSAIMIESINTLNGYLKAKSTSFLGNHLYFKGNPHAYVNRHDEVLPTTFEYIFSGNPDERLATIKKKVPAWYNNVLEPMLEKLKAIGSGRSSV